MKRITLATYALLIICYAPLSLFAKVTVAENSEGAPGNSIVLSDGEAIWPPKGEGCDPFIKCCDNVVKAHSDVGLFCQLAIAADGGDCKKAFQRLINYMKERTISPPKECSQGK